MADRPWQTGRPRGHQPPVPRLTRTDIFRQLGLMALIGLIWTGMLIAFLSVFAPAATSAAVARVSPADLPARAAPPTARPTSQPTDPPTDQPTVTPTTRPTATSTIRPTATSTARPTDQPTIPPTTEPTIPPVVDGQISFAADVQPLFDRLCVKCHGGEKTEEGLVLKSYAEVMAGSNNGPVVVPGDTVNSLLVDLVTQGKMPKRGPRLLPGELRIITDWVAQGARDN